MAHTHTRPTSHTHFSLQKYEIRLCFFAIFHVTSQHFPCLFCLVILQLQEVITTQRHVDTNRHYHILIFLFYAFFEQFPMKSHLFWQLKKNVWKVEKTKDER